MADDNEIMTADTQAENTADTADTGQTVEEQLAAMAERITALESIVGEDEYELRYSGEQVDELLDGTNSVFKSKTVSQTIALMNRLYPLYMKWGSFTINMRVNADNGQQSTSNTIKNFIADNVTNPVVIMVCDWGKTYFRAQNFGYSVNGRDVSWKTYLSHSADQGGNYSFKVYYLILGKITEGGSING